MQQNNQNGTKRKERLSRHSINQQQPRATAKNRGTCADQVVSEKDNEEDDDSQEVDDSQVESSRYEEEESEEEDSEEYSDEDESFDQQRASQRSGKGAAAGQGHRKSRGEPKTKFVGHHRLVSKQFEENHEIYSTELDQTMQTKYMERSMMQQSHRNRKGQHMGKATFNPDYAADNKYQQRDT